MATRIRTVCLIHSHLAPAFGRLGVKVMALDPPAGEVSLPQLLAALPEQPDCVIQQEHLSRRLLLTEVDRAPCPTVFWARDPHLNFFWQRHYAPQFAAVAATQPYLLPAFAAAGAARVAWVTWHGQARPFVPHADRPTFAAFVGRVTTERPRRRWFVEHLSARSGLLFRDDAFGPALAAVYDAARIAPNESIAGEVNQRLFEVASSGCCPLTERTPEAVETLFRPGVEALFFDDVLELDDHLRWARQHPRQAEAMGRAAWDAVAKRHLPEHRAAALLALAEEARTAAVTGEAARAQAALTLAAVVRAGQLAVAPETVWSRLLAAPTTPAVMEARIGWAGEHGLAAVQPALWAACLADERLIGDVGCAAACCLAAWAAGDVSLARLVHLAWCRTHGRRQVLRLADRRDGLLFFARAFAEAGRLASPGLPFDPARQLPVDAAQCLMAVLADRPDDLEAVRCLEGVVRRLPGRQVERLGCLSTLSLHRRDDWGLGLELGCVNLQAFRLEPGLAEVAVARDTAARLGQAARFARRLDRMDPSGRVRRALAAGW